MSELSPNTLRLVSILYMSHEAQKVSDILEHYCGTESLGCNGWSPKQMERIWFAILKLGNEAETSLDYAIKLANVDWRDLLIAAGFGEDLNVHEKWYRSVAN